MRDTNIDTCYIKDGKASIKTDELYYNTDTGKQLMQATFYDCFCFWGKGNMMRPVRNDNTIVCYMNDDYIRHNRNLSQK